MTAFGRPLSVAATFFQTIDRLLLGGSGHTICSKIVAKQFRRPSPSGQQQAVRSVSARRLLRDANRSFNERLSGSHILNVCFFHKPSFRSQNQSDREDREAATTGRHHETNMCGGCRQSELVSWKLGLTPRVHSAFHITHIRETHVL